MTVSDAFANSYFSERLYADEWTNADATTRTKALRWAERLVDAGFCWLSGAKTKDADGTVVWNDAIFCAVCEEAIHLLKKDPTNIPDVLTKGLASASVGSVATTFDKKFVVPCLSPACIELVGELGVYIGRNNRVVFRDYSI